MNFEEMYRDYIKCDRKCELFIDETGYVEYQIWEGVLCIGAIYLKPDFRGASINEDSPFVKLGEKVVAIAKERGCTMQHHYLMHSNPAKDRILSYLVYKKFKLSHNDGNTMIFYREI